MRREASRVSFLMCPFCVPALLLNLTTMALGGSDGAATRDLQRDRPLPESRHQWAGCVEASQSSRNCTGWTCEIRRAAGAAVLAAHPHDSGPTPAVPFPTCYFARRWRELRGLVDRVELFNGRQLFGWVAEAGLPAVACGDLHRAEQLPGWTTLVPCERDEEALVDYLRSPRPVFLTRLEQPPVALAA